MKFLLVVSAVLAVAAAAKIPQKESKLLWSIPMPFFNAPATTTKAPPTTVRTTIKPVATSTVRPSTAATTIRPAATSTTRAPTTQLPSTTQAAPAEAPADAPAPVPHNPIPAEVMEQVDMLMTMIPELLERAQEIFSPPPAGPSPLDALVGSLPVELQDLIQRVWDYLLSLPAGTQPDLFKPITGITSR